MIIFRRLKFKIRVGEVGLVLSSNESDLVVRPTHGIPTKRN